MGKDVFCTHRKMSFQKTAFKTFKTPRVCINQLPYSQNLLGCKGKLFLVTPQASLYISIYLIYYNII
jgi:hypothetical protein